MIFFLRVIFLWGYFWSPHSRLLTYYVFTVNCTFPCSIAFFHLSTTHPGFASILTQRWLKRGGLEVVGRVGVKWISGGGVVTGIWVGGGSSNGCV